MGKIRNRRGRVLGAVVLMAVASSAYAVPPQSHRQSPQCPAGQSACQRPDGAKGACSDHQADRNNCGACGVMCGKGQNCVAGQCQTPNSCPAGQSACQRPDGAKGACSDHQADRNNCGACGVMCMKNQRCQAGVCQ